MKETKKVSKDGIDAFYLNPYLEAQIYPFSLIFWQGGRKYYPLKVNSMEDGCYYPASPLNNEFKLFNPSSNIHIHNLYLH